MSAVAAPRERVELLAILAAILQAGDRANPDGHRTFMPEDAPPDQHLCASCQLTDTAYYCEQAWELLDMAEQVADDHQPEMDGAQK